MERRYIQSHKELEVYRMAFAAAMQVFEMSKRFPGEERYSLTDQIRRSSRSVSANITEAWRKRRYEGSFVVKLNDAESEAAETQTWLDFAVECGYLEADIAHKLYQEYDHILGKLVNMIANPSPWLMPTRK
jgi:four helix bundle protein